MDINTLASVGDFVAGVGVIISLIYLSVQVRNNTAQVRAGTTQAYSDAVGGLLGSLYGDPEMLAFFVKAVQTPDSLTASEGIRWRLLMTRTMRHFDTAFYQFRTGTMDPEIWAGIESSMIGWTATPGMKSWYRQHGDRLSSQLRTLLETKVPGQEADAT